MRVTPRAKQARAIRIEEHGERFRVWFDFEAVEMSPSGRYRVFFHAHPLKDPTKAMLTRIEQPRAMTGLEYQWGHASSLLGHVGSSL